MSFSHKVREELAEIIPPARHCQIAELSAVMCFCGRFFGEKFCFVSEHEKIIQKIQLLLHKALSIETQIGKEGRNFVISITDKEVIKRIFAAVKLSPENMEYPVSTVFLNNICCKRSFLRGAFLVGGSISDPEKYYHLEIVVNDRKLGKILSDSIKNFELDARIVARRGQYVVYLKEGSQIVDMLNVMGAHISLLDLENVRILKEVRNNVNRQCNCETANMNKTVNAAVRQIEDIKLIDSTMGIDALPESLSELCRVRLENFDMPLKDLGALLSVPVGKSGVNHRLRKISQIADEIRNGKSEEIRSN